MATSSFILRRVPGRRKTLLGVATLVAAVAVACGGDSDAAQPNSNSTLSPATTVSPGSSTLPTPVPSGIPTPATVSSEDGLLAQLGPAERAFASRLVQSGWKTDLTRFADDLDVGNILSGGVPRDGIGSIDAPRFSPVSEAPSYLRADEPVIVLDLNDDVRAYPLSIMMWHEIVNDVVGDEPVTVTFCPLCNTSLVFPRTLEDGTVLEFGVSGFLLNSDLIMYDRQTESLWQQITGRGMIGTHSGTQLDFLPVSITAWSDFSTSFPDGQVLLRPTITERHSVTGRSLARNYELPPYAGYDSINSSPFLFDGPLDGRLLPMERVATVALGDLEVAYPFSFLAEQPVVNDVIGEIPITVFFDDGTESAFTGRSGNFSKSGSTTLFNRTVDDLVLTFALEDGVIKDNETGSTWNKFGKALEGELEGARLEPIVHAAHFWFAWAAFSPDTVIRGSVEMLTLETG